MTPYRGFGVAQPQKASRARSEGPARSSLPTSRAGSRQGQAAHPTEPGLQGDPRAQLLGVLGKQLGSPPRLCTEAPRPRGRARCPSSRGCVTLGKSPSRSLIIYLKKKTKTESSTFSPLPSPPQPPCLPPSFQGTQCTGLGAVMDIGRDLGTERQDLERKTSSIFLTSSC